MKVVKSFTVAALDASRHVVMKKIKLHQTIQVIRWTLGCH